ncbi:MAG: radical SAM protein [Gammaproteobacteria bacterium]|nr:radical SAM protein [Gammaproteobacteria bacterium]|tara:strand:- start:1036 stop:1995 length:960 start_codon:yes stop_codon:yes gene_type:complete
MHDVYQLIKNSDFPVIFRDELKCIQINMGYRCNQSCVHCHVNAGPNRNEMMDRKTVNEIINFISKNNIDKIDITGGAPELNPYFTYLIEKSKKLGCHVIDRSNLTVLLEPGMNSLVNFLKKYNVEIIASLPCYSSENVNQQRGKGVFEKSICALIKLNNIGYGINKKLPLNLVYNPQGDNLPGNQKLLENQYKSYLYKKYKIKFNRLYTITNMPISRFGSYLISKGKFHTYMNLLKNTSNTDHLNNVMCKTLISIDYKGYVYDCDFNQMLNMGISGRKKLHISKLSIQDLYKKSIKTGEHCYGCIAGNGSSCEGNLKND